MISIGVGLSRKNSFIETFVVVYTKQPWNTYFACLDKLSTQQASARNTHEKSCCNNNFMWNSVCVHTT